MKRRGLLPGLWPCTICSGEGRPTWGRDCKSLHGSLLTLVLKGSVRACVRSGTRGVAHAFPICILLAAHHLTFLDAVAFVFKLLENRALERNREGP